MQKKTGHNIVYLSGFVGYLSHQFHRVHRIHLRPLMLVQQLGELHRHGSGIRENIDATRQ